MEHHNGCGLKHVSSEKCSSLRWSLAELNKQFLSFLRNCWVLAQKTTTSKLDLTQLWKTRKISSDVFQINILIYKSLNFFIL